MTQPDMADSTSQYIGEDVVGPPWYCTYRWYTVVVKMNGTTQDTLSTDNTLVLSLGYREATQSNNTGTYIT